MRLVFLGTSAGVPARHRGLSGLAVRQDQRRDWWLFDCGEGTQCRLLRAGLPLTRFSRIFISHLHGDHCLGLFGLLSSRSLLTDRSQPPPPLVLCGPVGLRHLVEEVLRATFCRLAFPVAFQELSGPGEVAVEDGVRISAVALSHGIPCYAFLLQEPPRPGRFNIERAQELGIPAGPHFARLKQGETVVLPDGRRLEPADFVGPARAGRLVVIAGDNHDPELLAPAMANADVLVHEATHTEATREQLAHEDRHSTARAVGNAARRAGVRHLVLTHFSARFGPPGDTRSEHSITEVRAEATAAFGGPVILARDLAAYDLDQSGRLVPAEPEAESAAKA